MTTLLLPPAEIAMLRTMKGLAYLLAVMITLDRHYPGRAFRADQVALVAGIDARTASKQLQELSTLDRVILTSSGYVLTQGGRAMFLSATEAQDLAQFPQAQAQQALEAQNDSTRSVRALKKEEEEEDSLIKKEDSSTSSDSDTQSVGKAGIDVTTKAVLSATSLLDRFENGVFLHGLDLERIHARMALGWVAQAYNQRARLSNPSGLVYSRLKDESNPRPQTKYYECWSQYLPDEYLEAAGVAVIRTCDSCGTQFAKRKEYEDHLVMMMVCEYGCGARFHDAGLLEAHYRSEHTVIQPVVVTRVEANSEVANAWAQTLSVLQSQMPRASFSAWVYPTKVIGYDGSVVTIGARNNYACEWLESRISSAAQRILVGIMNKDVTISFMTSAEIGDEDSDD